MDKLLMLVTFVIQLPALQITLVAIFTRMSAPKADALPPPAGGWRHPIKAG